MSPTAGGNQARKRRGAGGGTNHGKGNRLNPHADQQAAWDALLKPAAAPDPNPAPSKSQRPAQGRDR